VVSSVPLSVLLTVVFTATGGLALLRFAALRFGLAPYGGDQVAQLSHVMMSVAMVAMVWAYAGAAATVVQVVAFAGFAGYFLDRMVRRRVGSSAPAGQACPALEYHLMMSMTMIWMAVGMPVLMRRSPAGMADMSDMSGMPGMGGSAGAHAGHGAGAAAGAPVPGWAMALTVASIGSLLVAAVFWAGRAVRRPARLATVAAPAHPVSAALTPRSEDVCHLAMSLGMTAMFVTMI
jgi:uncharacterized protein DUF5134